MSRINTSIFRVRRGGGTSAGSIRGVNAIFSGHYHRNAYGRDARIEMITTEPVGMPLGRDQSGIRVVRVWDGGMEHRYYELGAIPNRIDAAASPLPLPLGKVAQ